MDYLSPYLESLAHGVQVAQHIRAAADQQAQLAKQNEFENRRIALSEKLGNASSELSRDRYNREGRQQDFSNSMDLMHSGVPLTGEQDPSRIVSTPGGNSAYIPTPDENAQRDLSQKVKTAEAVNAVQRYQFSLPEAMAESLGMPKGTTVTLSHPPTLGDYASSVRSERPVPAAPPKTEWQVNDRGDATPILYNPKTGKYERQDSIRGVGKTRESAGDHGLTPNAQGVQGRFDQREVDKGQKDQEIFQQKEQEQHTLRSAYGDALATPDGETVIDPKSRKEVPMSAAMRQLYQRQYEQATKSVEQFSKQQKGIRQRFGWGEFSPDQAQPGATQPSGGKAQEKPAGSAPVKASRAQVSAFAKQKGVSEAKMLLELKRSGVVVE